MRNCQSCGELIEDDAVECPKCGLEQVTDTQASAQDMSNTKKSSRKPLFIILGILAVAAIAFCVWFFIIHKNLGGDKKTIEKKTGAYIEALGDLDVKKIVEFSFPRELLQTLVEKISIGNLSEFNYETDDEFEDIYNDTLAEANAYIDSYVSKNNLSIDIKDYDVTSIDKLNIDEILEFLYSADSGSNASEVSLSEAKALVEEYANEYDIDIDKLYNVYVSVDVTFNVDGEPFEFSTSSLAAMLNSPSVSTYVPFDMIDRDGGIALFMAYQYKDEYYLIPNIAIFAPSLFKYKTKASISADLSNSKLIYTAVQTLLGDEEYYEFFTGEGANTIFAVTEQGLNELPAQCGKELRDILYEYDQLPTPSLKDQGQTHFTFMVDDNGQVYVYVAGRMYEDEWELMPDQDMPY